MGYNVREYDKVKITGQATSPVRDYVDLVGTVATVDKNDGHIKLWVDVGNDVEKV